MLRICTGLLLLHSLSLFPSLSITVYRSASCRAGRCGTGLDEKEHLYTHRHPTKFFFKKPACTNATLKVHARQLRANRPYTNRPDGGKKGETYPQQNRLWKRMLLKLFNRSESGRKLSERSDDVIRARWQANQFLIERVTSSRFFIFCLLSRIQIDLHPFKESHIHSTWYFSIYRLKAHVNES